MIITGADGKIDPDHVESARAVAKKAVAHRGVADVLMVICDGLTGLPDTITTVWPKAITQTCVVHLLRNIFRYSGRQHWAVIANALKPVYTAPTEAAARERFAEFTEAWGGRYPAIVRLWHAKGTAGRLTALEAMSRLLNPGGRLVLTSRNWELVRSAGPRIDVRDRLIRRNDRDAVVSYYWQIGQRWEQEHFLEIVVAQIEPDGAVRACSERLSIWPYRYEDLVAQLRSVGFTVQSTTFDPESDGYLVVASRDQARGTPEPAR